MDNINVHASEIYFICVSDKKLPLEKWEQCRLGENNDFFKNTRTKLF